MKYHNIEKEAAPIGAAYLDNYELVGDVRQKSDLTCSLDGLGQLALMHSAGTGGSAGQNLATLGKIAAELCGILVIDRLSLIYAECANLSALAIAASHVLLVGHCSNLLSGLKVNGLH